jgi:hypothetical protein
MNETCDLTYNLDWETGGTHPIGKEQMVFTNLKALTEGSEP